MVNEGLLRNIIIPVLNRSMINILFIAVGSLASSIGRGLIFRNVSMSPSSQRMQDHLQGKVCMTPGFFSLIYVYWLLYVWSHLWAIIFPCTVKRTNHLFIQNLHYVDTSQSCPYVWKYHSRFSQDLWSTISLMSLGSDFGWGGLECSQSSSSSLRCSVELSRCPQTFLDKQCIIKV